MVCEEPDAFISEVGVSPSYNKQTMGWVGARR